MIGSLFHRAPDWRVRSWDPADIPVMARLHAANFARGWSEDEIARLLDDATVLGHVLVDRPGGAQAGFALSRVAADEAEILTIAVAAPLRRKGGGNALLSASLNAIAQRGAARVILEVDERNQAALRLYARFGFQEVGARPAYYARPDGTRGSAKVLAARLR